MSRTETDQPDRKPLSLFQAQLEIASKHAITIRRRRVAYGDAPAIREVVDFVNYATGDVLCSASVDGLFDTRGNTFEDDLSA